MPVYVFTYHAYLSWLPDHRRGYVKRHEGVQPPDPELAEWYRRIARFSAADLGPAIQKLMIDEVLVAAKHQNLTPHFISTEPTHLHTLVSWKTSRTWQTARAKLRESLTRRLNHEVAPRPWFSRSASRRRVRDHDHFEHLMNEYLVKHCGWKWRQDVGLFLRENPPPINIVW